MLEQTVLSEERRRELAYLQRKSKEHMCQLSEMRKEAELLQLPEKVATVLLLLTKNDSVHTALAREKKISSDKAHFTSFELNGFQ